MNAKKSTKDEVAEVEDQAEAQAEGAIGGHVLRHLSPGSERRCNRAKDNLAKAVEEYRAEMGRIVFPVDEDGNKTDAEWSWLVHCKLFGEQLNMIHNDLNALRQKMRQEQGN